MTAQTQSKSPSPGLGTWKLHSLRSASRNQSPYLPDHSWQVLYDVLILDADNSESQVRECLVSLGIIFLLLFMDASIQFNDQSGLMAIKICNETRDYLLPSEMDSQLVPAQFFPQKFFCRSHFSALVSPFSLFENGEMPEGQRGRARASFTLVTLWPGMMFFIGIL
jgi:hypothetical protein